MPSAAPRPCTSPGCPNLTHRGQPKCDAHQKATNRLRGSSSERGYDYRWQKARASFLARHPLCELCLEEGRPVPATVVDHREAHKGDPVKFWDESNWRALCKPHHDARVDEGDFGRAPRI